MNFFKILINIPNGVVLTSKWLKQQGISTNLLKVYRRNQSIYSISRGAYVKINDIPTMEGAIFALQQDDVNIHIGGRSALSGYHNIWHYLRKKQKYTLFSSKKNILPQWFKTAFLNDYTYCNYIFLHTDLGIELRDTGLGFKILTSCPERAFLELLYSCPEDLSVQEAYEILELLPTLRPKILQDLLTNCSSVKVKRLFLYLSSKVNHIWNEALDLKKIDLGTSVYTINDKGKYVKEFNIVVNEVK